MWTEAKGDRNTASRVEQESLFPQVLTISKVMTSKLSLIPKLVANTLSNTGLSVFKELLNEREEEVNRALIKKISLKDALEQPNTMKTEHSTSVRCKSWKTFTSKKLRKLRKKMRSEPGSLNSWRNTEGLSEAVDALCAVQVEYQQVVLTSTEERKVRNNLQHLLEMIATHVGSLEKHLEEQIAKADREYEKCMSEDLLENIKEITEKYKSNAALFKAPGE